MLINALLVIATLSLSANGYLILLLRAKPKRPQSIELQEFLADLLTGAMVMVKRIDPESILMRSPKR